MNTRLLFILFAIIGLVSCQRLQEDNVISEEELCNIALSSKTIVSEYIAKQDSEPITKGSSFDDTQIIVPDWAYTHIINYMSSDIEDWDVANACFLLASDEILNIEQKTTVAKILGCLDYLREEAIIFTPETKSKEEDCLEQYKANVKEILITDIVVGGLIGGAVGRDAIGFELGLIGGLWMALKDIRQAGYEYTRCWA